MDLKPYNEAIRDFQKATAPAALRKAAREGHNADGVKEAAALTLREALAAHCW